MTEVKNSSLDLLTRQMSDIRKSSEKPVDELSGFKTMIKSRNQKKDDKSPETKERNGQSADCKSVPVFGEVPLSEAG